MITWKENRKTINISCANCGINFNKVLSEYVRNEKKGRMHFCSLSCSKTYKKISEKLCKTCGELIKSGDNRAMFCSNSCAAIFNNKNRKGEKRTFSDIGKKNMKDSANNRHSIDRYLDSPSYCRECSSPLSFNKRNHVFCNIICRRVNDKKNISAYQKYYKESQFNFNLSDYPNEFSFELINKYGWYRAKNHGDNLFGVSRDHMISIKYGYENNILSEIIKHPANCELLLQSTNSKKNKKCSITYDELLEKINNWNLKYNTCVV
jgi:predicted nucleic acid-binding Zn ribbon protein